MVLAMVKIFLGKLSKASRADSIDSHELKKRRKNFSNGRKKIRGKQILWDRMRDTRKKTFFLGHSHGQSTGKGPFCHFSYSHTVPVAEFSLDRAW